MDRIGYGAAHAPGVSSFQWWFLLTFQGVPAGVLFVGLFRFPEPPRQLIEKDNGDETMRVLRKLYANKSNDDWIQAEFVENRRTIVTEKAVHVSPGRLVLPD